MIPNLNLDDDILEDLEEISEPSYTYKMDLENNRVSNYCNDLEAIKQAVYKILNTERYDFPIYSQNYGIELKDLFGQPTSYVMPELERRITDAIMQDERITDVYNLEFERPKKNVVAVTFTIETDFGTFETGLEVDY